jgi:hypothetical protein
MSPLQALYLHTEQHKHRINAHNTDIHALSGIQTHDLSVRASEDSSWVHALDRAATVIGARINTAHQIWSNATVSR